MAATAGAATTAKPKAPLRLQIDVAPPMQRELSYGFCPDEKGAMACSFKSVASNGAAREMVIRQQGEKHYQLADFKVGHVLGRGSAGGVKLALHRPSNSYFALKEIPVESKPARKQLSVELQVRRECGEMPHIVRLFDVFYANGLGRVYLVLELMDWGSLENLLELQEDRRVRMPETVISSILARIAAALHFLHDERQVIHRDLKPSNIVLSAAGAVKLADFGVSRVVLDAGGADLSWVGTQSYMSPERVRGEPSYSYRSDVWSMGILLLECATGCHPYHDCQYSAIELSTRIADDPAPLPCGDAAVELSGALLDLIGGCLSKEERERLSSQQLLCHPFFAAPRTRSPAAEGCLAASQSLSARPPLPAAEQAAAEEGVLGRREDEMSATGREVDAVRQTIVAEWLAQFPGQVDADKMEDTSNADDDLMRQATRECDSDEDGVDGAAGALGGIQVGGVEEGGKRRRGEETDGGREGKEARFGDVLMEEREGSWRGGADEDFDCKEGSGALSERL